MHWSQYSAVDFTSRPSAFLWCPWDGFSPFSSGWLRMLHTCTPHAHAQKDMDTLTQTQAQSHPHLGSEGRMRPSYTVTHVPLTEMTQSCWACCSRTGVTNLFQPKSDLMGPRSNEGLPVFSALLKYHIYSGFSFILLLLILNYIKNLISLLCHNN